MLQVRPVREMEYEDAGRVIVTSYEALQPEAHGWAVRAGLARSASLSDGTAGRTYAEVLADVGRRASEAEVLVAARPEVVGCVTFVADAASPWAEDLEPEEAGVRMLAVHPAAQGQGVGRALLRACVARAQELGRNGLFLHTTPWMTAAHHLYETVGFVRVPDRDWLPAPEVPLLAFRLDLDAHR